MLCWKNSFAAFYFLGPVINSDHETPSDTTEYSECRLVLSYWAIDRPPLGFCRLDGYECQELCKFFPFACVAFPGAGCAPFHAGWREGHCTLKPVFDGRSSTYDSYIFPSGLSHCQGENCVFSHENSASSMCNISGAPVPVPALCHCAI